VGRGGLFSFFFFGYNYFSLFFKIKEKTLHFVIPRRIFLLFNFNKVKKIIEIIIIIII